MVRSLIKDNLAMSDPPASARQGARSACLQASHSVASWFGWVSRCLKMGVRHALPYRDSLRSRADYMSHLSEQILQTVAFIGGRRQVLDFVEFLWTKRQKARTTELETVSIIFEVAQASIGGGGTRDLSTNPDHMQGSVLLQQVTSKDASGT